MSSKNSSDGILRQAVMASRREQELCVTALESGHYDSMSDDEWVALCEQLARAELAEAEKAEGNTASRR